jgi:coenzyme Q-binding protein COQ10
MAQATRSIVVNVPPEKFFQVVADFAKYPQFLPDVKGIKVGAKVGNATEVTYEIEVIKKLTYTLKHLEEPPNKLTWSFVKGDMMKDNKGSWLIEKEGEGKTRATYTIELKLGALVPSSVEKALAEARLPQMLDQFKKRAESLG